MKPMKRNFVLFVSILTGFAAQSQLHAAQPAEQIDPEQRRLNMLLAGAIDKNNFDLAGEMIAAGADVNTATYADYAGGRTLLMAAAIDGQPRIIQKLIDKHADLDKQDNNGRTALMEAAFWGHVNIAEMLINADAKVHLKDKAGNMAFDLAQRNLEHVEKNPAITQARKDDFKQILNILAPPEV